MVLTVTVEGVPSQKKAKAPASEGGHYKGKNKPKKSGGEPPHLKMGKDAEIARTWGAGVLRPYERSVLGAESLDRAFGGDPVLFEGLDVFDDG
jgi:hypothetical protein